MKYLNLTLLLTILACPVGAQWEPIKPGEWRQPAVPQPRASFPQPRPPVYPTVPQTYPNSRPIYPTVAPPQPGSTILRSGNSVHIFTPGQKTVTCTTFGSVTRCY